MTDEERPSRPLAERLEPPSATTRRNFIKAAFGSTALLVLPDLWWAQSGDGPVVILEYADGILVSDTTRCVGCRRCELACTEFNDGRAQPALARIKIARNYNFGPRGQRAGIGREPLIHRDSRYSFRATALLWRSSLAP